MNTAKKIIQSYDGSFPLSAWLKQFFKTEKKFGSTDRKQIAHLCYCWYRLGGSFQTVNDDERMLIAVFLCSFLPNKILEELKPEWNEKVLMPLISKIGFLSANNEGQHIFPFAEEVSREIDLHHFHLSFLIQPDLFLRCRPGAEEKVVAQLDEAGIIYRKINKYCLALDNQTKIEEILYLDRDVVVQDASSQKVLSPLVKLISAGQKLNAWDCCAASGGKSILFHDFFPAAHLTVSDVRETILINLRNRFKRAGINNFSHFVADISSEEFTSKKKFDVVICDAPCSGSGTWSRTPEQLRFFKKEKIGYYAGLQKRIAAQAVKAVKEGGYFLYITCSVFFKENEGVVEGIQKNSGFQLLSAEYLKGYTNKADTLFVALFQAS